MNDKLTAELVKKYPIIFRDFHGKAEDTAMCWGFECGDGWFGLLDQACSELQELMNAEPELEIVATQVKEKYGTLRFYVSSATDKAYDIIHFAENKSAITCEECGNETANGTKPYNGWERTLCSRCEFLNRL